jgi:peptide alpha-N-acetyltransferase
MCLTAFHSPTSNKGMSDSCVRIEYVDYADESEIDKIQSLVSTDLSEPYSIFTYRYFLHNWPKLCICAVAHYPDGSYEMVGTVVCKADMEHDVMKGYIAMLTVNKTFRKRGIGVKLATLGIERMIEAGCIEINLETEVKTL